MRCAASAMLRPTPPRDVVTVPGLVECFPSEASVSLARAVMSTAAEPMIINSARVCGQND